MKLHIIFASQTGNAQKVAFQISRALSGRNLNLQLTRIDNFQPQRLLQIRVSLFIVSTTGLGQVPDKMLNFWSSLLNKNLPSDLLQSLDFSIFGLGDSSYQDFNTTARMLQTRLKQLGANEFYRIGLGDDMHDFQYEAELHPWFEGLLEELEIFFPELKGWEELENMIEVEQQKSLYQQEELEGKFFIQKEKIGFGLSNAYYIKIQGQFEYEPGDTFNIRPPNSDQVVYSFMNLMNWENKTISIKKNPRFPFDFKLSKHFNNISLFSLLKWYIDLHGPVSRHFIQILARFSLGLQQEKLVEMTNLTVDGRNEFHRYIVKQRRNTLEVLWDFPSARRVPLNYFLQAARYTHKRPFSIASYSKQSIELLISVVYHKTPLGRQIKGMCTGWIQQLENRSFLIGSLKKARNNLQVGNEKDLILIGTGVGLAPLRSLLIKRVKLGLKKNTLIFGCRQRNMDFYCRKQLEELEKQGKQFIVSLTLFTAFSREEGEIRYVQQAIKANWVYFSRILAGNPFVFLCGKARGLQSQIKNCMKFCLLKSGLDEIFSDDLIENVQFYTESW